MLAPLVASRVAAAVDARGERGERGGASGRVLQFLSGLLTGCGTGLATQVFHNAALTGGRMAGAGERPSNMACMRQLLAEHGRRALWLNYPQRVGVIASWSAILNVAQPFR